MKRYIFEFISNYDQKSDYRLYVDGRYNTRITLNTITGCLSYADGSPVLRMELEAFAHMKELERLAALAEYPEYAREPFMQPRNYHTSETEVTA